MRSSLPSSAASLENYSKSVVKRCYLFSYLMSDLASLFKFSWFLCLVLMMGIVPGRGCHDSQRHPFSAPLEGGILFAECSAKGLYFRQKISTQHQLNASGLEQHHVTHWWRCQNRKGETWKAMLVRVLSLFSLLLSFPCWENGGLRRLSYLAKVF